MSLSVLNLNRGQLMDTPDQTRLDFYTAKYQNIRFSIPARSTFKVTQGFVANSPGIAYSVYQDVSYWWVILMFNGLLNPLTDLAPGVLLQLPSKEDIDSFLSVSDTDTTATITI